MALNTHLQDHLDKRSGGITYTVSGTTATITSATVPVQRLRELEAVADVTGYELVVVAGALTIRARS
jgi:hypothetical protein